MYVLKLSELTIKLHMSNQHQKSEINCPMNDVSYAQIAFKKLIFQARPANAHAESKRTLYFYSHCFK